MADRRITQHAIRRFIERVDRSASPAAAAHRIASMVASGRTRPNPRAWTNCKSGDGTVFIYSADEPEACLVATSYAVVTVVSRDLCATNRRRPERHGRCRSGHRPRATYLEWEPYELEAVA